MIILSHAGRWQKGGEKNTESAFRQSFALGFGTTVDVRDSGGRLVVSRGIPSGREMPLDDFLGLLEGKRLPLAVAVRADGLALTLKEAMERHGVGDWFVFDVSFSDMRAYLYADVPVFVRMSDMERSPAGFDLAAGVWLDTFAGAWYDTSLIASLLRRGKKVTLVSPELRDRDPESFWRMIAPLTQEPGLMLCTEWPEIASRFFVGSLSREMCAP